MGDALSKLAEGEQCAAANGVNFYGGRQSLLGRSIAERCLEIVLSDADEVTSHAFPTPGVSWAGKTVFGRPWHCLLALGSGVGRVGTASPRR